MEVSVSDQSSSPETVLPVPTAASFGTSPNSSTRIVGGNQSEAGTASYRLRCAKRGEGLAHSSFLLGKFELYLLRYSEIYWTTSCLEADTRNKHNYHN